MLIKRNLVRAKGVHPTCSHEGWQWIRNSEKTSGSDNERTDDRSLIVNASREVIKMESRKNEGFLNVIMTRRSIRDFKEGDVPREDLERILQAGLMAPSPGNSQPWHFHILEGRTKEKFVESLKNIQNPPSWKQMLVKFMKIVPAVLVVENPLVVELNDIWTIGSLLGTAASIQNVLLAIHSLGYGSVWIAFPSVLETAKKTLNIPGTVVGVLPIGHPAGHQNEYFNRARKPFEEVTTFYA